MSNATIALIVDCSGSMVQSNYLPYAKTDACTFVNIMQNNDGCSIIKFESTAAVVQSMIALASQTTKNNVCTLVQNIPGGNMTDMGDAIVLGKNQIGSAAVPRGIILLSDGIWNQGPDPLTVLPNNIPIYTIALGNNGQLTLMQQIATNTGGQYNFAPGYRQLAQIYNNIVSQSHVARTVTNVLDQVNTNYYREIATPCSGGASGTFTVNWDNEAVAYTPNTPVGNQVNIILIDPNGNQYPGAPVYAKTATVVFNVQNPMAGVWNIGCWYAGPSGGASLNCVWGAFEPTGSTQLNLVINNQAVKAGSPVSVKAQFLENGNPIINPRLSVKIDAPIADHDLVHKMYKAELSKTIPDPVLIRDGVSEDMAKIMTLGKNKGLDLYPRELYRASAGVNKDAVHDIAVDDTKIKGGYNIHVIATGISPKTKMIVQETKILSFLSM